MPLLSARENALVGKEINCLQEMILQLFFLAVIMTRHCAAVIFTITE